MVITGPLDFLTTSRSGESGAEPTLTAPASLAAWLARASGVHSFPVMTAAAPMTALRMRNDRRLIPEGMSGPARLTGNSRNRFSLLSADGDVFIVTSLSNSWYRLEKLQSFPYHSPRNAP